MSGLPAQRRHGPVDDITDGDLAARACDDIDAYAVLYLRYVSRVYRTAYRSLGSHEAAEDVTSEVFVKALRSIHGFRAHRAPFGAWLQVIARHAVVDHVRAHRRCVPLDVAPDGQDVAVDVEGHALDRVEAGRAWQAIDGLCAAQRTAVTLRLADGLPVADIAGRMHRSEGAVKLLLNRGLATVRTELSDSTA
jgi:RNA polymerase sigma-70 factor (ECF subfamily)